MKRPVMLLLLLGVTACTRDDVLQVQVPVPNEPAPGSRVVVVYERGANGSWSPAAVDPAPPPPPAPLYPPEEPPESHLEGCAPYLLPTLPATPTVPKPASREEDIDAANYAYIERLRAHIERVKKTLADHHTKYLKGCQQ